MSVVLGPTGVAGELPFVEGSDYTYQFQFQEPAGTAAPFPTDAELYYEIGIDGEVRRFDYTINADIASIDIDVATHADIPNLTPFKLKLVTNKNDTLVFGVVRRYGQ